MEPGWIWTGNLRPLMVELALLAGCEFDGSDWIAVERGVQRTDSKAGPWFTYPVGPMTVELALEPGADEMIMVKIGGLTGILQVQVDLLGSIMRNWHLSQSE